MSDRTELRAQALVLEALTLADNDPVEAQVALCAALGRAIAVTARYIEMPPVEEGLEVAIKDLRVWAHYWRQAD